MLLSGAARSHAAQLSASVKANMFGSDDVWVCVSVNSLVTVSEPNRPPLHT
jgi:hypothetical protein